MSVKPSESRADPGQTGLRPACLCSEPAVYDHVTHLKVRSHVLTIKNSSESHIKKPSDLQDVSLFSAAN